MNVRAAGAKCVADQWVRSNAPIVALVGNTPQDVDNVLVAEIIAWAVASTSSSVCASET